MLNKSRILLFLLLFLVLFSVLSYGYFNQEGIGSGISQSLGALVGNAGEIVAGGAEHEPDDNDVKNGDLNSEPDPESQDERESHLEPEPEPVPQSTEILIAAVGDIMVHSTQIRAQHDGESGKYDFTNNFQFVKPYISNAHLALANLETTFAGKSRGYSGYPMFNSPDYLADALKDTGFDVISTANNHSIDTGKEGLIRTVEVLQERGLEVAGTRSSESQSGFLIKNVEDIKVGISAYTYETPRQGGFRALNGIPMSKELEKLVDSFCYDNLEEDLAKMEKRVNKKKEQGAELIVFYLHWGTEYQRKANSYQEKIARALHQYGVDIIFGSHPHVLQPVDFLDCGEGGKQTLVIYSMGNFISNQRYETLGNRYTEDGIIFYVTVKKDFASEQVTIEQVSYTPTWVNRYREQGEWTYEILPLSHVLESKPDYNIHNENLAWRVRNSKENTVSLIEGDLLPVIGGPRLISDQLNDH